VAALPAPGSPQSAGGEKPPPSRERTPLTGQDADGPDAP
jgi:hypothetical protein